MNFTAHYKGFAILTNDADRFFVTVNIGDIAPGFNAAGYPTMNHAKGAITKVLKASTVAVLAVQAAAPSEALTGTLSARFDSLAVGDKFHDDTLPGHTMTKACSETATSDETQCGTRLGYGACEQVFPHAKTPGARPSRNKREGYYVGHCWQHGAVRGLHKTGAATVNAYLVLIQRGSI